MTQEGKVPDTFLEQVRKIAREEAARVYRSAGARNTVVSDGGTFTVKGGRLLVQYPDNLGGQIGVYFGDVYATGTSVYAGTGILVQDANGYDIATFRSDLASGRPLAQIRDSNQDTVISTDITTGQGLARPILRGDMFPARFADWTVETTSTTFVTLFSGAGYNQHAGMMGWARASMDTAATNGEIRFLVDGVQVGDPATWGFALETKYFYPTVPVGEHMEFVNVEIQGRVTVGTGALRVGGAGWFGLPIS